LNGYLEPTNQPYAIAKIAGLELCNSYRHQYGCNFISLMPTNLYGPNDNYDIYNSHVMPGMLRKFIEATKNNSSTVVLWGTGTPKREFLHSDDLADACLYFMKNYNEDIPINIGTGKDISIRDIAIILKEITGFKGEIVFDTSKPDGTLRKVFDTTKATKLGWSYSLPLNEGIQKTYDLVKNMF
jgi:GDP-L-fucose synthase